VSSSSVNISLRAQIASLASALQREQEKAADEAERFAQREALMQGKLARALSVIVSQRQQDASIGAVKATASTVRSDEEMNASVALRFARAHAIAKSAASQESLLSSRRLGITHH
jgi:hypothetical protein